MVDSRKERVLIKKLDIIKEILSEHTKQFPNIIGSDQRALNYYNLALFLNNFYRCNAKGQGPGLSVLHDTCAKLKKSRFKVLLNQAEFSKYIKITNYESGANNNA